MRLIRLSLLVAFGMLSLAGTASAISSNPECVKDARDEYTLCRTTCREAFQVDKDMCRDIDHDCAEACRAGRQACVAGPLDTLQMCKSGCQADLAAARQICRDTHPEGSAERDACIDAAQVIAFQCKDTCREGVQDELRLCRLTFRACLRACPEAP